MVRFWGRWGRDEDRGWARPALKEGFVTPPRPLWGYYWQLCPGSAPPAPSNRFATPSTAPETAFQPPVTAAAADLEPSLQLPSPSRAALGVGPMGEYNVCPTATTAALCPCGVQCQGWLHSRGFPDQPYGQGWDTLKAPNATPPPTWEMA